MNKTKAEIQFRFEELEQVCYRLWTKAGSGLQGAEEVARELGGLNLRLNFLGKINQLDLMQGIAGMVFAQEPAMQWDLVEITGQLRPEIILIGYRIDVLQEGYL